MGKRCKFVPPGIERLQIADYHRKRQQILSTKGVQMNKEGEPEKWRKATKDELRDVAASLAQAENDADWLDVKRELNAGETRSIFTDLVTDFKAGSAAELDPGAVGMTKAAQYIVGWSLVDARGEVVPFSIAALKNLNTDAYNEIIGAIDMHDEAVEAARTARKNDQGTVSASAATS